MMPPAHPPHIVETARRLRREGKSGPVIAALIGIPARTVHDWLKGEGETMYVGQCPVCDERFLSPRNRPYCSRRHYMKHYNALGALKDKVL